jgi:PilZ domain
MAWAHEREHYRVAYPTALRPKLLVHGVSFDVVDICERGLRFRLGTADAPQPGFEVQGVIRFKRGETVNVRGTVLRVVQGEVSAKLDEGIPLRVVMDEQRYLLDRNRHLGL